VDLAIKLEKCEFMKMKEDLERDSRSKKAEEIGVLESDEE